jgi:dihydrolipoamide dehydrogenase
LHVERVIVAIGFAPNTADLGLNCAEVQTDLSGFIGVNSQMQSSAPHIYAIGDVTGLSMLAHAAEAMGVLAAKALSSKETVEIDFQMLPRATFCAPQVASLGHTETRARDLYGDVRVSRFPLLANGKAQAMGDPQGFIKLIADPSGRQLLGAHAVGVDVAELLAELALIRQHELTPAAIGATVHLHPSLGEAVKEAALGLSDMPINI